MRNLGRINYRQDILKEVHKNAKILMFTSFKGQNDISNKSPAAVILYLWVEIQVEINHVSHSKKGVRRGVKICPFTMRVFCWWWEVNLGLQSCWRFLIKRGCRAQPRFGVCQKRKYYCSFSLNSGKQLFLLLASLVLSSSKIYFKKLNKGSKGLVLRKYATFYPNTPSSFWGRGKLLRS